MISFDRVFTGSLENPVAHREYADFIAPGRQSWRRRRKLPARPFCRSIDIRLQADQTRSLSRRALRWVAAR